MRGGARFSISGRIAVTNAPPDGFVNGLPVSGGSLCVSAGAVVSHTSGLPFLADGRLAAESGPVAFYDQGVPFTAGGLVALDLLDVIAGYSMGWPLVNEGAFAVELDVPPPPQNGFTDGFDGGFD